MLLLGNFYFNVYGRDRRDENANFGFEHKATKSLFLILALTRTTFCAQEMFPSAPSISHEKAQKADNESEDRH